MLKTSDYSQSTWRLKQQRAEKHKVELFSNINEHLSQHKPSIKLEKWDGKVLSYRLTSPNPIPIEWSLIMGDCVQNYRAALDSIYYAVLTEMAQRENKAISKKNEYALKFPIAKTSRDFDKSIGLKDFGTDVLRDDLVRHQPFNLQIPVQELKERYAKEHPLELLRLLSNLDKHRHINIVYTYLEDFTLFHEAGIQIKGARYIPIENMPNDYVYEFDVVNGSIVDTIHIIPRFVTGLSVSKENAKMYSVQSTLDVIGNLVNDYLHKLEYHLDNRIGIPLTPPTVKS